MGNARYSIGIDLGTTNCALASVPLGAEDARSEVVPISQWESASQLSEATTLPSFLYRPPEGEAGQLKGKGGGGDWIVGRFARSQAAKTPDRVVHSAKSWLCSHGMDRSSNFLPWGSDTVAKEQKLSPIRASALLLNYLRSSWNETLGQEPGATFDQQDITITVPASFDAAAQKLTLEAAAKAGFPKNVRLLEEPQAAFYRWLEAHEGDDSLEKALPELKTRPHHIVIVDIGGGTSDFSLFELRLAKNKKLPDIKRIAVSDHILLGGDNIDLALAHLVEPQLKAAGDLSPDQWALLMARCREIKEEALQGEGAPETSYTVAIPGRGSGLIASALSGQITRGQILQLLLEGFYPGCAATDKPERAHAALREWGLPYAKDSAITRHLAEFLHDRPQIDAVLFNGGSLKPACVRNRIIEQVADWQDSQPPVVLENPEPDLAVARGAARYGLLLETNARRIQAGAARALYLQAQSQAEGEPPSLVCILPKGTPQEQEVVVESLDLHLRVNQPVEFQLYTSNRRDKDQEGDLVALSGDEDFHALPPLQTLVDADESGNESIPVDLRSRLNAVGLLQVDCVSSQDSEKRWPLHFSLRQSELSRPVESTPASQPQELGVSEELRDQAIERIKGQFRSPWNKRDRITPARLTKSLEKILEQPKHEWSATLLRSLWPAVYECFADREHSFDHEETWVSMAGMLLRPGCGVQLDESRINQLWEFHEDGFWYPGKAMQINAHVLWRRVSGGLYAERQQQLLDEVLPHLRDAKNPDPEAVRLVGALERLEAESKREVYELLLKKAIARAEKGDYVDPYLVSLSRLINRAPLYGGPETVLPPEVVEETYEAFRSMDWKAGHLGELSTVFLRGGRVVDDRTLDVPRSLRQKIIGKLRGVDITGPKVAPLEAFVPLKQADQVSLFGESLPPGLVFGS